MGAGTLRRATEDGEPWHGDIPAARARPLAESKRSGGTKSGGSDAAFLEPEGHKGGQGPREKPCTSLVGATRKPCKSLVGP